MVKINDPFAAPKRDRFQSDLAKSFELPGFSLPRKGLINVRIVVETSRRVSTCQLCQQPIPKQTQRYAVFTTVQATKMRNGGVSRGQKYYIHVECMLGMADSDATKTTNGRCAGCGCNQTIEATVADDETVTAMGLKPRMNAFCYGTKQSYGLICENCQQFPRFRQCNTCGVWFNRYTTSEVLRYRNKGMPYDVIPNAHFACDYCAASDGLITHKTLLRERKEEAKFMARAAAAEKDLDGWLNG